MAQLTIGTYSTVLFLCLAVTTLASNEFGRSLQWHSAETQGNPVHEATRSRPLKPAHYGYAPYTVSCPNPRPTIRNATSISPSETRWLEKRRNHTVWAIRDFLSRANMSGFDTDSYMDKIAENGTALPNIGIAVSGGGWRALMNGAGGIAAFDNATTNSTEPGHVGGLLQAATYLAGLSGGSWLLGSLYVPQLRSVQELYRMDPDAEDSLWQFDNSVVKGPTTLSITQYYDQITDEVDNKDEAGFNTTITDLWGRGLSFQLFNAIDGGPNYTFTSVVHNPVFQSAQVPLPIVVAIERPPNQLLIPPNASIYEINPWEIGTFDPPTAAFARLQYAGSPFARATVPSDQPCVSGFDNMGFVVGTSSSLFNQAYLQLNNTDLPPRAVDYVSTKLEEIGNENSDVSFWVNPFYNYNADVNTNAPNKILPLVDGGETLQNIPLHPLLQPSRGVDVIFAVDSSADTSSPGANWPNGTSLVATYRQSLHESPPTFPPIPDQNTFVNLALNENPTFFGCDAENLTHPTPPLIVYIPNAPYTYNANISTFQLQTSDTERNAIIQNGYNVATQGNGTVASEWPACMACAMLARSFWKTQTETPTVCRNCFERYCWNGTTDATTPAPYVPTQAIKTSGACGKEVGMGFALGMVSFVGVCLTLV